MATEDDLGWEYFGDDPEQSPRMMEHMDWHAAPENKNRTGNYGERFLIFHRDYIAKFDQFRISKNLLPVSGWDPATPIPPDLDHPRANAGAVHVQSILGQSGLQDADLGDHGRGH